MSFTIPSIIETKRDGKALNDAQLDYMVKSIADKEIDDVQLGAFLMAVYLKGMNIDETISFTSAMIKHGETLEWPEEWKHLVVDKHSTGGVGDKVSLALAPALAALGLKVPMISGRGLGFTGGTLDKLESIPDFNVKLTTAQICHAASEVGCCIASQTREIVPADKKMYAARDVTATVSCIPLIVSSIIAKKAAENPTALVLDVKCGSAAFMKNEKDARELAEWLANTAHALGITTTAVLTKMDEPIGMMIGNSVEIIESIECLQGKAPKDLEELICTQGGNLLASKGKADNPNEGYTMIKQSLTNGSALQKFKEMLIAQNVSPELAENLCDPKANLWEILPIEKLKTELQAPSDGLVTSISALAVAKVLTELGAGRLKKTDTVNPGVGLFLKTSKGKYLKKNQVWAVLHHADKLMDDHLAALNGALKLEPGDGNERSTESRIIDIIKPTIH